MMHRRHRRVSSGRLRRLAPECLFVLFACSGGKSTEAGTGGAGTATNSSVSSSGGGSTGSSSRSSGGAGTGAGGDDASAPAPVPTPACKIDVTAQVLANTNIVLTGDSCVTLPAGTTQYDGVISGMGTLTVKAPNGAGTLIVTGDSAFTLPSAQQTETATKTANYYTIQSPNPPAVFIEVSATLQLGTSTSTTGSIASDLPNTGTPVINADNIEVDGTLAMGGGPTEHLGILSGTGTITQPDGAIGTFYLVGDDTFSGVLSIITGGNIGDLGVTFSLPYARAIFNNGSMIMNGWISRLGIKPPLLRRSSA